MELLGDFSSALNATEQNLFENSKTVEENSRTLLEKKFSMFRSQTKDYKILYSSGATDDML